MAVISREGRSMRLVTGYYRDTGGMPTIHEELSVLDLIIWEINIEN